MSAIITLTTDFGLADAYVAAMKGVVLGINPEAKLVDICHSIQSQNIAQAAFVLSTACGFFPQRTIHLVVVDPGVGTERKAIILRTPEADFVAPDNGVLSYIIQRYATIPAAANRQPLEPGAGLEAIAITRPQFWRSTISPTFHGRDIFAPVAAHLSRDVPPVDFGEAVDSLTIFPVPHPHPAPDGTLVGHILHIDNFGNLITSIKSHDLPAVLQRRTALTIKIGNETISGLSLTYGTGKGLMALMGSTDHLEISLKGGSASTFLNAGIGDEVKIFRTSSK
jgi:S-adenosylmethionine hydrolase